MKVFVTGASGFIGTAVVRELIASGHEVTGLARTESAAAIVSEAGATVLMGSLEDLEILKNGAASADATIHTAFIHDFSQYAKANETDRAAINAMGGALSGTAKALVVTGGMIGIPFPTGTITEDDVAENSKRTSEATAMALAEAGVHASVVRLPPTVHGKGDQGFIPFIIRQARKNNCSAYPESGTNLWSAVHRLDAAKVFCLAAEKAAKGALYNAVAERGIPLKVIAETIGQQLNLPVVSVKGADVAKHFDDWLSFAINADCPASSIKTQEMLGWEPVEQGLLEDMVQYYF